ncbi:C-factor [Halotydeus destructor]|nr:C-factor [Halotydeus destructor]
MALLNVVVTGANRGLGLEFVRQLLKSSSPPKNIIATCRKPDAAKELNDLKSTNSSIHVLPLDVKDYASHENLVKQTAGIIGDDGLDVLINNAGIYLKVDINNGGPELMMDNFEVNVVAPFMLTRAMLPLLKQAAAHQRRPVVANITSKMGSMEDNTSGNHYAYRASKAALNMVTKSLGVDLGKEGVLAASIHPGWVQTDMGGPNALITPEVSAKGMLGVIHSLDAAGSGKFFNYDGKPIPW